MDIEPAPLICDFDVTTANPGIYPLSPLCNPPPPTITEDSTQLPVQWVEALEEVTLILDFFDFISIDIIELNGIDGCAPDPGFSAINDQIVCEISNSFGWYTVDE